MALVKVKLVTIIAEAVLAEELHDLLRGIGASGYTQTEASGEGSRGLRSSTVLDGENIRLETLVSAETAERLMEKLARDYFSNYAVIAWVTEVEVVRAGKFFLRI
jgi:nitrogen regulatory protein PII